MTLLVACATIKLGPKRRSGHAPRAPNSHPLAPDTGRPWQAAASGEPWQSGGRTPPPEHTTPRICCSGVGTPTTATHRLNISDCPCLEQHILPHITQSSGSTLSLDQCLLPSAEYHLNPHPRRLGKPVPTNGAPQLPAGHFQRNGRKQHRKLTLPSRTPFPKSSLSQPQPQRQLHRPPPISNIPRAELHHHQSPPAPTVNPSTRPKHLPTNQASQSRRRTWRLHLFPALSFVPRSSSIGF